MKPLNERVALITGANSGIGRGAAIALAGAGVKVVLTARRAEKLDAVVAEIEAAGGTAHAIAGDIKDEAFATDLVEQTVAKFGAIDILVNSAGTIQLGGFENADTEEWRSTFDLNVFSMLYTSIAAFPHMKAQGGGDIIQISSTGGRRPTAVFASYGASKHAVNGMSWSMREEFGKHGVRVCVIEPGATNSGMAEQVTNPDAAKMMEAHVNSPTAMGAEDIGAVILCVVGLPARANVQEIMIRPTADVAAI